MNPATELRALVLISGGGTTLRNLIQCAERGQLYGIRLSGVISSRADAAGLQFAADADIPSRVLERRGGGSDAEYSERLTAAIDGFSTDLVVMGGFLVHWHLPPRYLGRTLNIHPALLPAFGGKGMYGLKVHAAVLASGARESGCTVHLVDDQFDHGPILGQRRLAIDPTHETPETLAAKVQALEFELYPAVLRDVALRGISALQRLMRTAAPPG